MKSIVLFFILMHIAGAYAEDFRLTVLTKPIGYHGASWSHKGVFGSIKRGFKALNIPFNYNISSLKDVGDVVWVVSNRKALQQAIGLKKKGLIKLLLTGPNMVVVPREEPLLKHPMVDAMIVHSQETIDFYALNEPGLAGRLKAWFVGVDPTYWLPDNLTPKDNNVLVYWKKQSEQFCSSVEQILRNYGWNPIRIRYGSYNLEQYKQLLNKCVFAVFISRSESQGIALAEAWAMNVPTLPWNPREWKYKQYKFPLSSCPYLCSSLGESWKTLAEFEMCLADIKEKLLRFEPRAWVLKNMTDEASAQCMVNIIKSLYEKKAYKCKK